MTPQDVQFVQKKAEQLLQDKVLNSARSIGQEVAERYRHQQQR